MAGIDRIGSGKGPTGPLQPANGVTPAQPAPSAEVGPETRVDAAKDAVASALPGKKSKLRANEELPKADYAGELPESLAALKASLPHAMGILLESGLPIKGSSALRRIAERLNAAGVTGVETKAEGDRKVAVGLSGDALARLKIKVQSPDRSDVFKPADLGLVGIRFGG